MEHLHFRRTLSYLMKMDSSLILRLYHMKVKEQDGNLALFSNTSATIQYDIDKPSQLFRKRRPGCQLSNIQKQINP